MKDLSKQIEEWESQPDALQKKTPALDKVKIINPSKGNRQGWSKLFENEELLK